MSDSKDGGPAFPHIALDGHADYRPGMSLRDYTAIHIANSQVAITRFSHLSLAAAELLIGRKAPVRGDVKNPATPEQQLELLDFWNEVEAVIRYRQADAMLAARSRKLEAE